MPEDRKIYYLPKKVEIYDEETKTRSVVSDVELLALGFEIFEDSCNFHRRAFLPLGWTVGKQRGSKVHPILNQHGKIIGRDVRQFYAFDSKKTCRDASLTIFVPCKTKEINNEKIKSTKITNKEEKCSVKFRISKSYLQQSSP